MDFYTHNLTQRFVRLATDGIEIRLVSTKPVSVGFVLRALKGKKLVQVEL